MRRDRHADRENHDREFHCAPFIDALDGVLKPMPCWLKPMTQKTKMFSSPARRAALSFSLVLCFAWGCTKSSEPTEARNSPQWFSDITAQSHLNFTHVAGTNYFMPDQVGSGIALFD